MSHRVFRDLQETVSAISDTREALGGSIGLVGGMTVCLYVFPALLAEVRAEEAFDYLRNVNSGHPGSITSVHAASAELAFEQLVLLVKQSRGGQEMARADIKNLLYLLVDVVIQFGVERHQRFVKEIWYDPERKRRSLASAR